MPATDVRAALLMDEPPASLDRRLKGQILPYLRRVVEATGVPVMNVSHDLTEILRFTDELIVLDRGLVAAHGRFNEMHFEESAARRGNRYHRP
jgi:molybdate transport system ATP-binding protein